MIQWLYVKPLTSPSLIETFERSVGYTFCPAFKDCVAKYNGGRPQRNVFDTDKTKGRVLKTFLSFNPDDRETVWQAIEWECVQPGFIPFTVTVFGDLICFAKADDRVVLLNHESDMIENVADSFEEFLASLRDL